MIFMNLAQKSATEISPVPLSLKFYGESESVNQNIDLYTKTIKNDKKMEVKMGVYPPLYSPFKGTL